MYVHSLVPQDPPVLRGVRQVELCGQLCRPALLLLLHRQVQCGELSSKKLFSNLFIILCPGVVSCGRAPPSPARPSPPQPVSPMLLPLAQELAPILALAPSLFEMQFYSSTNFDKVLLNCTFISLTLDGAAKNITLTYIFFNDKLCLIVLLYRKL